MRKVCCIPGCEGKKGSSLVSLITVPNGKSIGKHGKGSAGKIKKWSEDFWKILYGFRDPKHNMMRERLHRGKVFICTKHFEKNEICKTTLRTWLELGALLTNFLPKKSFQLLATARKKLLPKYKTEDARQDFKLSKYTNPAIDNIEHQY